MSRIGKKPIDLPSGVQVTLTEGKVSVKGPKGTLSKALPAFVEVKVEGNKLIVTKTSEAKEAGAMHGLARSLIQNLVTGVSTGFTRELEINGVGYRAEVRQGVLALSLGYSHPIEVVLPKGIEAKLEKNKLSLTGIDKEVLGQLAAVIREQRGPEPYKGKGIKYMEETIRRKEGKAGAS